MFFTDISLSIPFTKIEKILPSQSVNVEMYSEIEKQIIIMLNNKVAIKDNLYIVYDEKEEYDFLKNHVMFYDFLCVSMISIQFPMIVYDL